MPELPDVAALGTYLHRTSRHCRIERTTVEDGRILQGVSPAALARRCLAYQSTRMFGEVGWTEDPAAFARKRHLGPGLPPGSASPVPDHGVGRTTWYCPHRRWRGS